MSIVQDRDRPFPFSPADLEPEHLTAGVRHTLTSFSRWRDRNPTLIAAHVDRYTEQLAAIRAGRRPRSGPIGRGLAARRRGDQRLRTAREVTYFAAYNLGEIPGPTVTDRLLDDHPGGVPPLDELFPRLAPGRGAAGVIDALTRQVPGLRRVPGTAWLGERLDRLHRILPEPVVRAGGMGKAVRAVAGVLAIGAFDTLDATDAERHDHLARVLPGAYALGAAYTIVDDTLQDLPGDELPPADRAWCHQAILRGLATGDPVDTSALPDHPLAEELLELYGLMLEHYPFERYRHLYHAAEAMYLAQHRDAGRTAERWPGLAAMYDDILIKSGMSRVVANILGRRTIGEGCYARCINTIVLGQFKDDLRDRDADRRAGRVTPFTVPAQGLDTNPLYDLFAYDAYVVAEVFDGDPAVADALTYFGAGKLANHLSADPARAGALLRDYEATGEIARYLHAAAALPHRVASRLEPADTRLKDHCAALLGRRRQTTLDARTFVADRLAYLNAVTRRYCPAEDATGLERIVAYAMLAPGKRLRPALGLMLAEALEVETASIEPLIAAGELFHTASLLLDDLPAQDDATVRRGRPTAHTVFDEGSVQLAAVSMISTGFGLIAQLGQRYPAQRVTEVISYVGTVLGPLRLCRGQDLDLHLGRDGTPVTGEAILEMYRLKTSTTLEAALVPLMMLTDRPVAETELIRGYAHNAGIVFQIRDDILDLTASTAALGKDAGNDVGKINVVRVFGLAEAERLMRSHLDEAVRCCAELPFDTQLLAGMVTHFANRRR
jgi:geranylgeranyl pyrophosphate synthase